MTSVKPMKTTSQRLVLLILATALAAFFGASCSTVHGTVHGVGKDVENVGDHIERATR